MNKGARRPISRVLFLSPPLWQYSMTIHLGCPSPDTSRDTTRMASLNMRLPTEQVLSATIPTWSCSRWGLPCRPRYRNRGALLPHPFTLTRVRLNEPKRFAFCGTFPGVAPAGHYPAPNIHGARTFLDPYIMMQEPQPSSRLAPAMWSLMDQWSSG